MKDPATEGRIFEGSPVVGPPAVQSPDREWCSRVEETDKRIADHFHLDERSKPGFHSEKEAISLRRGLTRGTTAWLTSADVRTAYVLLAAPKWGTGRRAGLPSSTSSLAWRGALLAAPFDRLIRSVDLGSAMTSSSPSHASSEEPAADRTTAPRIAIVDADSLFVDAVTPRLNLLGMRVEPDPRSLTGQTGSEPDAVLVDGDGDDGDAAEWVIQHLPHAKRILMSSRLDENGVRIALQQGFHGAISKDIPVHRFQSAILSVMEGDVVVEVKPTRREWVSPQDKAASVLSVTLTDREREVLSLLVEGASGPEMAERLNLSPHTVRTHVQNLLTKLQVHSRVEAASFAVRHGIVEPKSG
jgi:two-component system, NarL family, nitrate/nitrite response regulator NarL